MWMTYGQWLQMNATSRAGASRKSSRATRFPSVSGSRKSGAGVPSGNIVELTATMVVLCAVARGGARRGRHPLTLTLSLRERGPCDVARQLYGFPLPQGEGQGEGIPTT